MGVTLTILGSGSGGNSALLETANVSILVDAGLSAKQLVERLALLGRTPDQLDAILLTHEHSDHIGGLAVLCRRRKIPVYANRFTAEAAAHQLPAAYDAWKLFETGQPFEVGDLHVESFTVPHDAADPVGFVFRNNGIAVGFATDLGHATRLIAERLRGVDALVLEANHDLKMLRDDPHRPWALKQRIGSRHGHLSNDAAAKLTSEVATKNLRRVYLAHLSRDCNRPELARATVTGALEAVGARHVDVIVTKQEEVSLPCVF